MISELTRDDIKNRIFEYLKKEERSQYQNLRQFGLQEPLNRSLTAQEEKIVLEVIHELLTSNILMPAVDHNNTGWPWFGLTAHGRSVLATSGPPVYDYDGYLKDLRGRTVLDPIVEAFVSEALVAYQRHLYLASVAMLGVASERAIWLLINAYLDAIVDVSNKEKLRSQISTRNISAAYRRFGSLSTA